MNQAIRYGGLAGLGHFLFLVVLQIERATWLGNFSSIKIDKIVELPWQNGITVLFWPVFQLETVGGSLLLASFVSLLGALGAAGRLLGFVSWVLLHLALILDQIGVRLLGNHFNGSWVEGRLPSLELLTSSLKTEWSGFETLNVGILLSLAVFLFLIWSRLSGGPLLAFQSKDEGGGFSPKLLLKGGSVLMGALLLLLSGFYTTNGYASLPLGSLFHHPVLSWFENWGVNPQSGATVDREGQSYSTSASQTPSWPRFASDLGRSSQARLDRASSDSSSVMRSHPGGETWQESLAPLRNQLRTQGRVPHVFLYVLESVGAIPLLGDDGLPSRSVAPNLSRLAKEGLTFSHLYTQFPATTRTHLSLLTGGETLTWGSVNEELQVPYQGEHLLRAFKELGYQTAVVSAGDLHVEGLGHFYEGLKPDFLFDYGKASAEFREKYEVHSWGGAEEGALRIWEKWQASLGEKGVPTFTLFLGISTHHPYRVPKNFKGPFEEGEQDSLGRYLNAISYNDQILGEISKKLETMGAILGITGDHGEAFGDRHANNFLHKSALFEENLRTFLVFSFPGLIPQGARDQNPWVSSAPGSVGQVAATLLELVHAAQPNFMRKKRGEMRPPQLQVDSEPRSSLDADASRRMKLPSLLSSRITPQRMPDPLLLYFQKSVEPEVLGIRVGSEKFLFERRAWPEALQSAQLYNLDDDPVEKNNLLLEQKFLASHQERLKIYYQAVLEWYAGANASFLKNQESPARRLLSPAQVTQPAFELLSFGIRGPQGELRARARFHPWEKVTAWIHWSSTEGAAPGNATDTDQKLSTSQASTPVIEDFPSKELMATEWLTPGGERIRNQVSIDSSWSRTWLHLPLKGRLESGEWKFKARRGDREVQGSFWVDSSVKLTRPLREVLQDQATASRSSSRSITR